MVSISLFNNKTEALKAEAGALYFAVMDWRTPLLAKILAVGVVAYALSPVDFIPDFIPFLGWIDDFIIIGLGLRLIKHLIPQVVWEESKAKAAPLETKVRSIYKKVIWTLIIVWASLIIISAAVLATIVWLIVRATS
ncbi:MAG: DUF1232 domain-containing protein [Candidatus Doudnabacteria bacterium]|nr:DUF1232 domain-containing protein [Candidatus Doudnabacteria bacterium]